MLATWLSLAPPLVPTVVFALGWLCGWVLLGRPRHLASAPDPATPLERAALDVVVPARNEEASIGALLAALVPQLRPDDRLVVVDDHSHDSTAAIAGAFGAEVLCAPDLPPDWTGKPHACHAGVMHLAASRRPADRVLVFLDADVVPGARLLDQLALAVAAHPAALVSVQPWHRAVRAVEQLSLLFNLVALMGTGAFAAFGRPRRVAMAFGPVLACRADRYALLGGHAHPEVRAAVLEDIALARRFGEAQVSVGERGDTEFRMYPGGLRDLLQGWSKGMGIGLAGAPWWVAVGVMAWMWSLGGGWLVSPWCWVASVVQLLVLGRVAGRWRTVAVLAYPLAVLVFTVVVVVSTAARLTGRTVRWKGRSVRPDQVVG